MYGTVRLSQRRGAPFPSLQAGPSPAAVAASCSMKSRRLMAIVLRSAVCAGQETVLRTCCVKQARGGRAGRLLLNVAGDRPEFRSGEVVNRATDRGGMSRPMGQHWANVRRLGWLMGQRRRSSPTGGRYWGRGSGSVVAVGLAGVACQPAPGCVRRRRSRLPSGGPGPCRGRGFPARRLGRAGAGGRPRSASGGVAWCSRECRRGG